MDTQAAVIVAQVLGPLYVVAGLGLITAPERGARLISDMETNPAQALTWGLIALGLGLLILAVHPGWSADWTALVTLIGWLATLKGVLLILAPDMLLRLSRPMVAAPGRLRLWAIAPITLGLFLTAMGFGTG